MRVILKDNIENLGKKGDIVKVAQGYGRNYLLPKQLALEVTSTNMKMVEMVQKSLRKGLEKEMKVYQSLIEKLNAVSLTFTRKAGEKDSIFGSVSVTDIRDALAELGFDLEKKKILLDEPIKRLGNYTVPIKVFHEDRAEIKLEVAKEGGVEGGELPEGTAPAADAEVESLPLAETAPGAAETKTGAGDAAGIPTEQELLTPETAQPEVSETDAEPPDLEPVEAPQEPETVEPEPESSLEATDPETRYPEVTKHEPEAEPFEAEEEDTGSEKTEETPAQESVSEDEASADDKDIEEKP